MHLKNSQNVCLFSNSEGCILSKCLVHPGQNRSLSYIWCCFQNQEKMVMVQNLSGALLRLWHVPLCLLCYFSSVSHCMPYSPRLCLSLLGHTFSWQINTQQVKDGPQKYMLSNIKKSHCLQMIIDGCSLFIILHLVPQLVVSSTTFSQETLHFYVFFRFSALKVVLEQLFLYKATLHSFVVKAIKA